MTPEDLQESIQEAKRFLARAKALRNDPESLEYPSPRTGQLKAGRLTDYGR